jgi:hypothetical protein
MTFPHTCILSIGLPVLRVTFFFPHAENVVKQWELGRETVVSCWQFKLLCSRQRFGGRLLSASLVNVCIVTATLAEYLVSIQRGFKSYYSKVSLSSNWKFLYSLKEKVKISVKLFFQIPKIPARDRRSCKNKNRRGRMRNEELKHQRRCQR